MKSYYFMLLVITLVITEINAGIKCYVCDTTRVDNYDPQVCDDTFLLSRGATIETDCAACTKERTYTGGVMFIKRGCERTLRWESQMYSCSRSQREREYVFGLPGTRCICLNDLCNTSPHVTQNVLLTAFSAFLARFLF